MLEPTAELLALAMGKEVRFTFFIDVGYLIQAEKFTETTTELNQVKHQIKEMVDLGHDVQLHVHPHWEKSSYVDGKWIMNTSGAYKLSDFDTTDRENIIKKYKSYLEDLIGKKVDAYRAGGWCIQPFQDIKQVFKEVGLKIDSSVFRGGYLVTDDYSVDFTEAPRKSSYRFEEDVCLEDENGSFLEYPISSYRYNPSFFWMLYGLGRLFPSKHKMIGDGVFLSQGTRKLFSLTSYTTSHVSTDGYFAKKLNAALEKSINLKHNEMVVIGHPKGNTRYSMVKLKEFIERNYKKHEFTSFEKEL